MIVLEPITAANALVFKAVRLRALASDPGAFGSTYGKEASLSDEDWFRRSVRWSSSGSIGLLAYDGDQPCGIVAGYTEDGDCRRAHVVSMWVDPEHRRTRVGTALIERVASWAGGRGVSELRLMVTGINRGAIAFYQRLGFRMSGYTEPYPNDPSVLEYEMMLEVPPPAGPPLHS